MMLAPSVFPEWLPPAVAQEAERLLNAGYADEELVTRLTTDGRMKLVWRELERREHFSAQPQISDVWAELRSRDAEPQESALTFFSGAPMPLRSGSRRSARFPDIMPQSRFIDGKRQNCAIQK
jgi:hypothetical protein